MNPEFIIVGAGSAGSVLANRLSSDHKVALFEAGPSDHRWDFRLHMPAALSHVLANDRYNWYYHSEPEADLNGREMYCPRGRVLGGSSSINGMIYVRGNPADFDSWAEQYNLPDWRYEKCLPYFKRAEACSPRRSGLRGHDGHLFVGKGSDANPLVKAWLAAAGEAGYPLSEDFNGQQQEGSGLFDHTIKSGRRFSTAQAYLRPAEHRSNLSIHKNVLVTRILIETGRAVGIEYVQGGEHKTLRAEREVIISAGAINSPQLLLLSGIGDAERLKELDIEVANHLPGVGQNLQDHLEIYIQYSCKKPVSIYPALKWYRQPKIGVQWYLFNTGLGATNHFDAGAFLRSSEQVNYPDLQYHFLPVAMNYDGSQKYNGHGFQVHVGPMKPTSRGSVTLKNRDPGQSPNIIFNYNATQQDQQVMRKGIRLARELISQSAFNEFRELEVAPGLDVESDAAIDQFVRSHAESAYHPSCTCRMGNDEMAVVDSEANVRGIEGLRVIDASIMPDITNGNLNAPVIMMAEKLSDMILS